MLVRLLYASRSVTPLNTEVVDDILVSAQNRNSEHGITGILCVCTLGNVFLQALEGDRLEINQLYRNLVVDPRHADVTVLHHEQIDQRVFSSWRMGRVDLNRLNAGTILRYSAHAALDPFSMSGTAAMAMVMELASTTTVISRTGATR